MRKLVLQMGVSLDGFVARNDGAHEWGYQREDEATRRWKLDALHNAGAHLMRRVTYEQMAAVWPTSGSEYATPMNEIPKVVFSKTLADRGLARVEDRARRPSPRRSPKSSGRGYFRTTCQAGYRRCWSRSMWCSQ